VKNVTKAARMSAAAFLNAVRLHRDSVLLFQHERYASAFQLSVLAQEEFGKTLLLEEFVFRVRVGERRSLEDSSRLLADIVSHRLKQTWFAKQEWESAAFARMKPPTLRMFLEVEQGRLESRKQDATYVGLTRTKGGGLDPNGRLVIPERRVTEASASRQLTRVADVLTALVEGHLYSFWMVDTDELAECMTEDLASELRELWPHLTLAIERKLARWREHSSRRGS
jgi:AbiV family abortive infection protein